MMPSPELRKVGVASVYSSDEAPDAGSTSEEAPVTTALKPSGVVWLLAGKNGGAPW
uniref:Uncharacterized protein n=1 Tax=Arundo donax TaxID=35708 RepID=A0A0A8YKB1_ARUDO